MARTETPEKEARRALNRLRRAIEKGLREVDALEGAIKSAEGDDFPADDYAEIRDAMDALKRFLDDEERRLREKVLTSGGLEPGRVRRSSSLD